MSDAPPPRILSIAGSDSSGGAGIQADIKTITMLGGYAMTALTAITAQNTRGVQGVEPLPPHFVLDQVASCLSDIGADAIKIGMLGSPRLPGYWPSGSTPSPARSCSTPSWWQPADRCWPTMRRSPGSPR